MNIWIFLQLLVSVLAVDTSSVPKTSIWVTVTYNGVLTTMLSEYSQAFKPPITTAVDSVASGGIGLGSLLGDVGTLKSYSIVTENHANGINEARLVWNNIYSLGFAIIPVLLL